VRGSDNCQVNFKKERNMFKEKDATRGLVEGSLDVVSLLRPRTIEPENAA
jgi:hypothetical protein